ncbi:fatty acid cis/trans isomerase [Thiohalobacter sp.]|uniref:fatty acid cis/trans isomerase n=1 Tax=Thiohalobacter sp. TaxID=2025948 RepID=UPI002629C223|nr:fatty acid cis/trans isomerase [Thiohalobacter sp.]
MKRRAGNWLAVLLSALAVAAAAAPEGRDAGHFDTRVRPILDRRCVVCHGCYDAPCQLKLSSPEGLRRGASRQPVYDGTRLRPAQPTRLFIDADSIAGWRALGFHPVLPEGEATPEAGPEASLLRQMLALKERHPQPRSGRLPADYTLGLDREQVCTDRAGFEEFAREHPRWGMPYAMPNLSSAEYRALVRWIAQGAPLPPDEPPSPAALPQIARWEAFFNGSGNKQRLVSRYLYEHLFHAHLHFEGTPAREFFRLVRSTTPPGEPIREIATVLPYDDPGRPDFHYRLRRVQGSIVQKNHLVYSLSDARLARFRALFIEPDYVVDRLPSYRPELAANPFRTFAAIPANARYRFLLDDAHFFIEGFVKGPVCRGQVALSVIEDRFWVMFFDPDAQFFADEGAFLASVADELQLPTADGPGLGLLRIWTDYRERERRYMAARQARFLRLPERDLDQALGLVWNGDGRNPSAALTVFRHFDSASVAWGLVGEAPETAWFLDYPLFERIHYLLVAGFNVFGNLSHQLNTRVYMDFLRMEGEDNFLAFLPAATRRQVRARWYRGLRGELQRFFREPQAWLSVDVVTGYRSDDPLQELYRRMRALVAPVAERQAGRNRCDAPPCGTRGIPPALRARADRAMAGITRNRGARLHAFPEVAHVRVRSAQGDMAYSILRNKAYRNVSSFLADKGERERADIEHDTVTVVDWLEGNYPNFFFEVDIDDIEAFARQCAAIRDPADYERFVLRYGVRRTHPGFWAVADWFQGQRSRQHPLTGGILDLNRYDNL